MRTFQKRRVVPRENWMPVKVANAIKQGNKLKVVIAADDPDMFDGGSLKLARRVARRNGYRKHVHTGRTEVFGQNAMALKEYIFRK